jgi:hypothetical protein
MYKLRLLSLVFLSALVPSVGSAASHLYRGGILLRDIKEVAIRNEGDGLPSYLAVEAFVRTSMLDPQGGPSVEIDGKEFELRLPRDCEQVALTAFSTGKSLRLHGEFQIHVDRWNERWSAGRIVIFNSGPLSPGSTPRLYYCTVSTRSN